MSNFNVMGSYSGIDMSVIDQMIEAEKAKGVKFTNQKDKIEREQGAWKDVGTRLNSLTQKIDALNKRSTFESRNVTSTAGDNSSVSVSAGNSAPIGNYQVKVDQLATSTRLVGGKITIPADDKKSTIDRELGINGSFNFRNDEGQSFQIKVNNEDSLRKITQNINAQTDQSGIEASIVDNRLILKDAKMGEREIVIESTDVAKNLGFGQGGVETGYRLIGDEIATENLGNLNGQSIQIKEMTINFKNVKSLEDVVDQINAKTLNEKGEGVTASINNGRLVLTDLGNKTDSLEITADSAVLENLQLTNKIATSITDITISTNNTNLAEAYQTSGQNAIFKIDGLEITRDTNRISDAIEGIAFTLKSEGATEVVSITNNTQKGVDAMKEFVDQYNSVMNFIQTQTDVGSPGEDNNTVGALVGEGSIMRLQSGLRSTLMQRINGKSIADFGVEIDRYGVASLDESKLNKALQEDPTSLSRFFYRPDLDLGAAEGTEEIRNKSEETKGMSELFKNFLDTYTARSKGIISTKQQSYDRMIKNINEQIETFNERIDRKRARYIQQFSALDTAMMRAESQLEYLYSQIGLDQK